MGKIGVKLTVFLWCILGASNMVFGFGQPPQPVSEPDVLEVVPTVDIKQLREEGERLIRRRQYSQAEAVFSQIPTSNRSDDEVRIYRLLTLFETIESQATTQNMSFEELVEDNIDARTNYARLYGEAQWSAIHNKLGEAQDILKYLLHLQNANFRGRALYQALFGVTDALIRAEDVVDDYLKDSERFFYGGSYLMAIEKLLFLKRLDPNNALVFERLGSSYYMSGETELAIENWSVAQYLNPGNKTLDDVIKKAKAHIDITDKPNMPLDFRTQESVLDAQTLGVFREQDKAYVFAKDLREKGFSVMVEQLDGDRWAVKVPRKELLDETSR